MTTKILTGTYEHGYALSAPVTTLSITASAYVEGYGVISGSVGAYTVANLGTVKSVGQTADVGVFLGDGGVVTNGSQSHITALIEGQDNGVRISASAGSIINFGTLASTGTASATGGQYAGVELAAGGSIANGSGADNVSLIEGQLGVYVGAAPGTVSNFGTIESHAVGSYTPAGVHLADGGVVTNGSAADTHALILGPVGVWMQTPASTVRNFGTIESNASAFGYGAIYLGHGGSVVNGALNDTTAAIVGDPAIEIFGGSGTVSNFGSMSSIALYGGPDRLTNGARSDTTATINGGVLASGANSSVINLGTIVITGGSRSDVGVQIVDASEAVTNGSVTDRQALIEGYYGVLSDNDGRITNFGTIEAIDGTGTAFSFSEAVYMVESGTLVAEPGSMFIGGVKGGNVIVPSGVATFEGGLQLFRELAGAGTADITGGTTVLLDSLPTIGIAAIEISGVDTVIDVDVGELYRGDWTQTGGTLFIATDEQMTFAGATDGFAGTLTGGGTIHIAGGSDILDPGCSIGVATLDITGAATAIEIATSLGFAHALTVGNGVKLNIDDGKALTLTSSVAFTDNTVEGAGHLITDGATMLSGVTLGGTTEWINGGTLDATGKLTVGDAAGDRAVFVNQAGGMFNLNGAAACIDTGVSASNELENEGLLERSGAVGTSVIAPRLVNTGTIEAGTGTIDITGIVSGSGLSEIRAGATLEFAAAVGAGGLVDLDGAKAVLLLSDAAGFKSQIEGFGSGRTIDLRGGGFAPGATLSYSGTSTSGTLTVRDGGSVARIALLGQYAAANFQTASDGSGGLDITFAASPAPALALAMPGH